MSTGEGVRRGGSGRGTTPDGKSVREQVGLRPPADRRNHVLRLPWKCFRGRGEVRPGGVCGLMGGYGFNGNYVTTAH